MISETTIQFLALSLGHGKGLGMLSDAIPNSLNKLDTLLDAKAQDFFKLGWTHAPKSTPASARMQSGRITPRLSCGARTQSCTRHGPPARRQLEPAVRQRPALHLVFPHFDLCHGPASILVSQRCLATKTLGCEDE